MKEMLAAAVLLASSATVDRVPVAGLAGAVIERRGEQTALRLPGGRPAVALDRDGFCEGCALEEARVIARPPGAVVFLVTYASRPRAPTAMCGAGMEEVLHVVFLRPTPREALAKRIGSCWFSIEYNDPPTWDATMGILSIEGWRSSEVPAVSLRWRIGPDGVQRLAPEP